MVIKNGIDTNTFRYSEEERKKARKELRLEGKFVIGHIGRFAEQKNHPFLLQFYKIVADHIPNAHLVLIGTNIPNPQKVEEIKQLSKDLGIYDRISFLGMREDASKLYQAMDIFILPSLYEGLPVVGVEAQAAGLPCLFSDSITKEVELLDETVYLPIKGKTAAELWAKKIIELSSQPFNEDKRSNAYRIVAGKGFDVSEETKRVENLLLNG